jgi:hypothetical protein
MHNTHMQIAVIAAACVLLGACASTPKPAAAAPPPMPLPLDASYDWHGLLPAPFGSGLKDIPLALHEVLQFHDEAPGASATDDAECYASNASPPRFVDRVPEEYLLCFKHDRLSRVQATVRVQRGEAAKVFADACGLWMKSAGAEPAVSPPQNDAACEGAEAQVRFSGRLEGEPDDPDAPLSIQLDAIEG